MTQPIFRFAPSPNGRLHLGHAYSALLNRKLADEQGGLLLLRIDDADQTRCTPQLEAALIEDLSWLGIHWDGKPRRQSEHNEAYHNAVDTLIDAGLAYPALLSRKEIRERVEAIETASDTTWPRDPDGSPHYPGEEKKRGQELFFELELALSPHAVRLNLEASMAMVGSDLFWKEDGEGPAGESGFIEAAPDIWGDFLLFSKDGFPSYHLSCVIDDAASGVTNVVRGRDLFWSTSAHRLLQALLHLPVPAYLHHDLILDTDGKKLSKSRKDTSLAELRAAGLQPEDIRKMVGL